MKNIKLKIFTILVLVLLQIPAFGHDIKLLLPNSGEKDTIKALELFDTDVSNILSGGANDSIVSTLNTIFVGADTKQSKLDGKIDVYMKGFYNLYTDKEKPFLNETLEINGAPDGLVALQDNVKNKVKEMITTITLDAGKEPTEPTELTKAAKKAAQKAAKKGSGVLTAEALVGPDGYSDNGAEAEAFIKQLLKSTPLPKTFFFPDVPELAPSPGTKGDLQVTYPVKDTKNNRPFTKSQELSIASKCYGSSSFANDDKCDSDYERMVNYITNTQVYKEYKAKTDAKLAQQTVFLDNIFRIFGERYKSSKGSPSLVEKEKKMASDGLAPAYYDALKVKSVADVNLETLHALHKIAYFLHKLHLDNERVLLMSSVNGMQNQLQDMQDESAYIKPIVRLIDNACWDDAPNAPTAPSVNKDAKKMRLDKKEGVCENPMKQSSTS